MTDEHDKRKFGHRAEDRELIRDAFKDAVKEYLDEASAEVGRWTIKTVVVLGIAAGVYFILISQGWKSPT